MTFRDFVASLNQQIGIHLPDDWALTDEIALAQRVLEKLNEYLFQTYDGIGTTRLNNKEYQYFSEFHKYWETHHAEIINAQVVQQQARVAALALHNARLNYGAEIFNVILDTHGLPPQAIAQVRFFTANQDFREPPEDQFGKYLEDDTQFDEQVIADDPNGFMGFLGTSRLSQSDKRLDFAKHAAEFLIERGIDAYGIAAFYNNDAQRIRDSFLDSVGIGYGRKKTDMFIRDMFVLGVWPNLSNMQVIDVASDRNTMKLALRTRVLQTDIPLLSSFLDIFGYQYGYIDTMSAASWRAVWEEWQMTHPETAPIAPCMMDFLLYRIGREYCDDKLVEFVCQNGHQFLNFGAQLRKCRQCRTEITPVRRLLPCQSQSDVLPRHDNGLLRLNPDNLFYTFNGVCIFESACQPKSKDFKKLSPPKAISIIGRTGWTDSYAYKGEGGGGMMG
ncbi:MAG: hypothetical protein QMD04_07875 [Anaerolineales bacterium]|nr:hypothetical protein [Anaerolineales bacterium]